MKITMEQVVPCKDCRYYHPENRGRETWVCDYVDGLAEPQDDDFCIHGKRKGEQDDA